MRTNLLPDNVGWGSKNADVSWENEPTLRNWLENTYAKRLSEAALKTIVPVTIRYSYGSNSSGTLKDQRFFIPTADEFNQFPGGKTFWERSFSGGRENATSARPPDLLKGAHSLETNRIFIGRLSFRML